MQFTKAEKILIFLILIFIFPALLINLGLLPLIEDESIRALVALEMDISGDYITPTLGEVLYFNKPPLFNWIILFLYKITNSYDELIIRIPTVFFIVSYGITIFLFTKKQLGKKYAFINAMIFITCGRLIFYDSMLGLIDITFSWITYLMFHVIYFYYQKKEYAKLFILTYILTAIGFLFKGLPSIVFTGITLLVVFISDKNFKKLFHLFHFIGFAIFLSILLAYYYLYNLKNPGALETVFSTLFSESSKRTVAEHSLIESVIHFFKFPFDLIFHFLPWTLLVILIFAKGSFGHIKKNPYLKYLGLIFIFNILIYWFSPNVYPRYFFMLIPLIFTIFISLYKDLKPEKGNRYIQILEILFFIMMVLIIILYFFSPFDNRTKQVPYSLLVSILSAVILITLLIVYLKMNNLRMLVLILAILVFRTSFNLIILKVRENESRDVLCRNDAMKVAEGLKCENIYLYEKVGKPELKAEKIINYQSMYYLTRETRKILTRGDEISMKGYFITYDYLLKGKDYKKYYDMRIRHNNEITRVVKFSSE